MVKSMLTDACQRWRGRTPTCRPAGEPIDTRAFEVAPLSSTAEARAFVEAHHYSGTYVVDRERFGLWSRDGHLMGVAVFGVPVHPAVITRVLPGAANDSVELSRFVLLDAVAANGESWFLARCFEQLRATGYLGVVSFSDPLPRKNDAGETVHGGHVGTIYQAHNATYVGRGRGGTLTLLPDGTTLHRRALTKVASQQSGWRRVVDRLVAAGLPRPGRDHAAWLRRHLPRLERVKHPGNHKYVWALDTAARRHLPPALPYPKLGQRELQLDLW